MLQIKTTGVEDYLDGSANIKALIIGGPGAGKTRMSSFWPSPIFLDCENGRGSLADRNMPYAEIKNSKDMLDALEYLKSLERTPKAQRQFQTVVVDTVDSFQRIVKDEWVQSMRAQSFSGFEAWGYLDTKMQQLFTRLLNLDYNVLVLVHYKDKQFKDGENTVREFVLQLQGQISDIIYNDFGLVGWLGTYWAAEGEGRVQKRGLTFQPTPDKPMLKDRFHVTPKWMEIEFTDNDYQQIFEAFFNRPEFEEYEESEVVGEIPSSDGTPQPQAGGAIAKPDEGGALPESDPVEQPLEKKLKPELEEIAKGLGIQVKGNMLKGEIIAAIKAAPAKKTAEEAAAEVKAEEPTSEDRTGEDRAATQQGEPEVERSRGFVPQDELRERVDQIKADAVDPTKPASEDSSSESTPTETAADVSSASPEPSSPTDDTTATSSGAEADQAQEMTTDEVAEALGATVISEEKNDAPSTQSTTPSTQVAKPSAAPSGPSACADCQKDLSEEWADPSKKDYIRLSFVKHRRYLCTNCLTNASK